MTYAVKIENLTKSFGNHVVLDDFSLNVKKGSMIAIQGKSGSGKSTLLNIIGGLEKPSSGDVIILDEKNVKPNSKRSEKMLRYNISYLFQNYALIDNQTVKQNIKLAMHYRNDKDETLITSTLESVGLKGFENKKIYTLSGGEQQRVALARTMVKPGEIVLADEPTGNVDDENKEIIINILKILKDMGKTIIVVTHDTSLDGYFDDIVYLT